MVAEGQKLDGKFQGGYVGRLVNLMNKRLPGCGLIQKHITSKLIVWKKCHVVIAGILAHSGTAGFGMDPSTNMLYEEKPDAWAEYAKVNPKAVKDVKGKCFPYHIRWKRIFGNDQAIGATRTDISDAVNKLFTKSNKDQTDTNGSSVPSNVFNSNIEGSANAASSKGSSQDDGKGKGASSKKRKSLTNESLQIQMMMGEWIETAKSALGESPRR